MVGEAKPCFFQTAHKKASDKKLALSLLHQIFYSFGYFQIFFTEAVGNI